MRRVLTCVFFLCLKTIALNGVSFSDVHSEETKGIITDLNSEPSSIVAGCVNVISGNFVDQETDLIIPGPESLTFSRSYCSNDTSNSGFIRHWQSNQQGHLGLTAKTLQHETELVANVLGSLGSRTYFYASKPQGTRDFVSSPNCKMYESGLTNISSGKISGQNDLRNSRCHFKCSNTGNCLISDGAGEIHEYGCTEIAKSPNFKFSNNEQFYREYLLKSIKKPSGMGFEYHYTDDQQLKFVILKNRWNQPVGHLQTTKWNQHEGDNYAYRVESQDGRFVQYNIQKFGKKKSLTLKNVQRSDAPDIHYEHEDGDYTQNTPGVLKGHVERIKRVNKPDGRFIGFEYYDTGDNLVVNKNIKIDSRAAPTYNRVKRILAPCGTDSTPLELYSFDYCVSPQISQWGTGVYDALGNKTDYFFNHQNRLQSILKFKDHGQTAYTHEQLFWWDGYSNQTLIKARCFAPFGSANKTYAHSYFYDPAGNLTIHITYGNIRGVSCAPLCIDGNGNVTSTGPDQKIKTCAYSSDGRNLLTYSKEGAISQTFTYYPDTNLMTSCLNWNSQGVYERKFFEYDENAAVITAISDDGILLESHDLTGVTQRFIEYTKRSSSYPHGLPIEVKKVAYDVKTGQELLIERKENRFDQSGRLLETKVYDSNNAFAFSTEWTYDAHGNVLSEKNPLGHMVSREYDANDNLIKEVGPTPETIKTFTYDYSNRLIRREEHHPDGTLAQHFMYDLMSRKTAAIDIFGQQTDYAYDAQGRVITETGPPVFIDGELKRPTTHFAYDELNHPIAITDALGVTVKTAYTIFGKPYRKEYPDGSVEVFEYDLMSRCVKSIAKNGAATLNTYDEQGRLVKEEILAASGETMSVKEWGYHASQLLFEKDPMGNLTEYTYDAYGRQASIQRGESLILKEYDSLGRLHKTIHGDHVNIVKYDFLNQVIEEKEEDLAGNTLKEMHYSYDAFGNKTIIQEGTGATTETLYDSHGVPVKIIDAEGNITLSKGDYCHINAQGQAVLRLETVDSLGNRTVIINDTHARPSLETTYNAYHEVLHEKAYTYDLGSNCKEIIETPYCNGEALEPRVFAFEYDASKNIVAFTQGAGSSLERRTQYQYNLSGEKITTTKPDGMTLHYSYDALGRLEEHHDANCTIHYRYHYDANSNLLCAEDLVRGNTRKQVFDAFNYLTSETLPTGLKVDFTYDPSGKLTLLKLPDQSAISYSYQGSLLKKVHRLASKEYSHEYIRYDLSGKLLEETSIFNAEQTYEYSPCGNLTKSSSEVFTEDEMAYDASGNLLKRTLRDHQGQLQEDYQYDDLGQLTKENGLKSHTYQYDSLNNRLAENGSPHSVNVLNQLLHDKDHVYTYDLAGNLIQNNDTYYTYDALDRLIQVKTNTHIFEYAYDDLNRCISITQDKNTVKNLFYLNQAELGSCSPSGEINELQILGVGRKTEPCAALAIELEGTPYAVARDQTGNIRALIDAKGKIAESYRYSAFGLMETYSEGSNLNNPWAIAGKRYQPEINLALFGYRFYSPESGRWITQDPAGLAGGPNLYAYLHNSPLVHYDAFGLFEDFSPSRWPDSWIGPSQSTLPTISYWNSFEKYNSHLVDPDLCMNFYDKSCYMDLSDEGRPPLPSDIGIGLINGIWNDKAGFKTSLRYISDLTGGYNIDGVFNATHGYCTDIAEYGIGSCYVATEPVTLLHEQWNRFFENSSANSFYLQLAHSQGVTHARNALLDYPEHLRNRIFVLAIAPGSYIFSETCGDVFHYRASWNRDFVPRLDRSGAVREKDKVFDLPSHPNASLFDHEFMSPTYTDRIDFHINKFMKTGLM